MKAANLLSLSSPSRRQARGHANGERSERQSVFVSDGHATGRDRGPPRMRRPRGGAGRRPAAVSEKEVRAFPSKAETL